MDEETPIPRPPSPPLLEKNSLKDFIANITPRPDPHTTSTSCRPSAQIAAAHAHEHLHHDPKNSGGGNGGEAGARNRARSTSWDSFNPYSPTSGSSRHSRINSWSSAAGQGMRPVGVLDLPQWGSTRSSFSSSVAGGGTDRSRQSSQTSHNLSHGHGSIPEHGADKTLHQDKIFHAAAILPDTPASSLVDLPEEEELQSTDPMINTTLMPPQFVLDQLSNNEHIRLWCFTPAGIRIGHASQQDPYSSLNELYDRVEDAHKLLGGPPKQDDQLSFHEMWSASRTFLASLRHLAAKQAHDHSKSSSLMDKPDAPSFDHQARAWSTQFDLIFSHPYIHVPHMFPVLSSYICRLRKRMYAGEALSSSAAVARSGSPKVNQVQLDTMDRLDPVLLNEARKQHEMEQALEPLAV